MIITYLGLGIICLAWLYQVIKTFRENANIQSAFVGIYAAGVLLLVIDGFSSGVTIAASLNLVTLILSAIVLLKMGKK